MDKKLVFYLEKQKISSVLEEIDALVSVPICPCLFMLTYALLHVLLCLRLCALHSFTPYVPTRRG